MSIYFANTSSKYCINSWKLEGGGGGENANVSYKTTGQNYVSFAHSTNASGIQFTYDENENIPSRLGTTCVSGMLTCLGNISCPSLYNHINMCLTSLSYVLLVLYHG